MSTLHNQEFLLSSHKSTSSSTIHSTHHHRRAYLFFLLQLKYSLLMLINALMCFFIFLPSIFFFLQDESHCVIEFLLRVCVIELQIRQEKPYYIADPEVDSLVSDSTCPTTFFYPAKSSSRRASTFPKR